MSLTEGRIKPPTEICNTNWDALLQMFRSAKTKEDFINLIADAKTRTLTEHQLSGILARCNNKLNGTYGSTSTAPTGFYKGK